MTMEAFTVLMQKWVNKYTTDTGRRQQLCMIFIVEFSEFAGKHILCTTQAYQGTPENEQHPMILMAQDTIEKLMFKLLGNLTRTQDDSDTTQPSS